MKQNGGGMLKIYLFFAIDEKNCKQPYHIIGAEFPIRPIQNCIFQKVLLTSLQVKRTPAPPLLLKTT